MLLFLLIDIIFMCSEIPNPRDLSYGRGSTAPLKGAALPKISTVDPWDGKDGQPPVEEDSFDDKDEL